MTTQQRHEAPAVGDAILRMMRALVARAADGDTEALEQLARIEQLAKPATTLAMKMAHEQQPYSWTLLGDVLGCTRQAARQRVEHVAGFPARRYLDWHRLHPGRHNRSECRECALYANSGMGYVEAGYEPVTGERVES